MTRYEAIEAALLDVLQIATADGYGITTDAPRIDRARAALALPEDSNENVDESRWAARCGMVQGERDIAMYALKKIAKRIPKEPSHSKESMVTIAADALDKIGNVFEYCKACGGAHPRDPILPACSAQTSEDSKTVNADWQPIETAPKDGTLICLLCAGRSIAGFYYYPHPCECSDIDPYWVGFIPPIWGTQGARIVQPTKWQHMPAPPKDGE